MNVFVLRWILDGSLLIVQWPSDLLVGPMCGGRCTIFPWLKGIGDRLVKVLHGSQKRGPMVHDMTDATKIW